MKSSILVVGGTGKTGRRVAAQLNARGVEVRIGSRSADPPFDWQDQKTWPLALRDVASAYVSYYPDLSVPGAAETVKAFAELAVKSGVKRLVLLSGRGEPGAELAEQAVRDSGASWTILRCSWFSQNFSEGAFREQVMSGEVALPFGSVREPFVDADDIADVAVAALTRDGHAGQLYELTGPRLLTFAEAVAEIAKATGREIRYEQISMEQYEDQLRKYQVPADFVGLIHYLFTEVLDGRNALLTDGVERALGRRPRDFSDYARDAAQEGIWNEVPAPNAPEAALAQSEQP
jgi:uncharacterized protein YbjT (DUF2867 family)